MNIGITCYPSYGGSGVVATELGKALAKNGHSIHFITYDIPGRLLGYEENVYYHEVEPLTYPLFEHTPYALALAVKMAEVARYQNLDILHAHYAIPHSVSAYLAKQLDPEHHVKTVTTLHGTDITVVGNDVSYLPIVEFSIDNSDGVTAVSEYLKKATFSEFKVQKEITVIYNFVDMEYFKRREDCSFRSKFAPNNEKILIHISNFRPVKRVETVLNVFQKLLKGSPVKLLLVGDGPERSKAEKICREEGFCQHVHFLGKQDSVAELLSVSDAFILPSLSESFGLAALEAMSCEVPVVTSKVGGLPELVQDPECGYTLEPDDITGMVDRVAEIFHSDALRKQLGQNGRTRVSELFSETVVIPQYEQFYEGIIG